MEVSGTGSHGGAKQQQRVFVVVGSCREPLGAIGSHWESLGAVGVNFPSHWESLGAVGVNFPTKVPSYASSRRAGLRVGSRGSQKNG